MIVHYYSFFLFCFLRHITCWMQILTGQQPGTDTDRRCCQVHTSSHNSQSFLKFWQNLFSLVVYYHIHQLEFYYCLNLPVTSYYCSRILFFMTNVEKRNHCNKGHVTSSLQTHVILLSPRWYRCLKWRNTVPLK